MQPHEEGKMAYQQRLKYGLKALHFTLRHRALVGGVILTVGAFAVQGIATAAQSLRR
jgi:hypothetical protein